MGRNNNFEFSGLPPQDGLGESVFTGDIQTSDWDGQIDTAKIVDPVARHRVEHPEVEDHYAAIENE